ncbi:MAG: peptide MFS transporter [Gammaproteobacteria bacterium]|nr:peptide MFS transporter [Gammaproteobacteria bacterium]
MWERFSFYGMRALLIFYLTQHFLFSDADAASIYASYGALVYLTPVIGGLVADRYLGFRRAVIVGAVLLCIGHLGMAFEGEAAIYTGAVGGVVRDTIALQVMYASIAFIIVGVGFLKPSISSIVGSLYKKDDPRRDGGFTLFYMGINVGAMTSALACGYLGQTYGWAYGFGLAGVGMLLGLVTFMRGKHLLGGAGEAPDLWTPSRSRIMVAGALGAVVIAWQLMQWREVVGGLVMLTAVVAVGGIVIYSFLRLTRIERDRMLVVLLLTGVSVVFWAFFEQAGSSMNLFTERNIDREVFGITLQASQLQSLNPGFIILLAPFFSWLWVALARRGQEPSTPAKFGLGVVQVGLGFVALVQGAASASGDGMVALGWLALAYLLHTTGELCLSPVGLSMVTKLSVPRVVGLMMGVWFLSSAFSHYVAGIIAAGASVSDGSGQVVSAIDSLPIYTETFSYLGVVAVGVGCVVLMVSPFIRRYMHPEVKR